MLHDGTRSEKGAISSFRGQTSQTWMAAPFTPRMPVLVYRSWATGLDSALLPSIPRDSPHTREYEAIESSRKHEVCEATSPVTWHTVLQQTFFESGKRALYNNDRKYSAVNTQTSNTVTYCYHPVPCPMHDRVCYALTPPASTSIATNT